MVEKQKTTKNIQTENVQDRPFPFKGKRKFN